MAKRNTPTLLSSPLLTAEGQIINTAEGVAETLGINLEDIITPTGEEQEQPTGEELGEGSPNGETLWEGEEAPQADPNLFSFTFPKGTLRETAENFISPQGAIGLPLGVADKERWYIKKHLTNWERGPQGEITLTGTKRQFKDRGFTI